MTTCDLRSGPPKFLQDAHSSLNVLSKCFQSLVPQVGQSGARLCAICNMLTEQLEELSQQADAPNFYWALAAMPRPLIDLRHGIETEMHVLDLWMPDLRDLDAAGNDPAFWEATLNEALDGFRDLIGS